MDKTIITRKMLIKKKEKSLNRFIISAVIIFCVTLLAFSAHKYVLGKDLAQKCVVLPSTSKNTSCQSLY